MRFAVISGVMLVCALGCSSTSVNPGTGGAGAGGTAGGGTGGAGAGTCAPTPTDAGTCTLGSIQNCAYCGHDCLNAKCTNGACEPGAVGSGEGYSIALSGADVFFHTDQAQQLFRVGQAALDQDSPMALASLAARPVRVVVHDGLVYVSQLGSVVRVPATASAATQPVTVTAHVNPDDRANDMLVDGDYLYFVANYGPAFRRFNLKTAAGEETVAVSGQAVSLRADAANFYFAVYGNGSDGLVMRMPRDEIGKVTQAYTVASGLPLPGAVELLGEELFIAAGASLLRTAKSADAQVSPVSIASFGHVIGALTTDGCNLYLTEGGNTSEGGVWRVSPDGSKKERLAAGQNVFLGGISLTPSALFFGGAAGIRRIMR